MNAARATATTNGIAAALAGALLFACTDGEPQGSLTEVIVEIDAEPMVVELARSLRVEVSGSDGVDALEGRVERLDEVVKPIDFPKRVALVPIGGDTRRAFALTATARDEAGEFLAHARLISGYVPGQVRYARLLIEGDACLRKRCEDELTTCSRGVCSDALIDATELSTDSAAPTPVRFGSAGDASAGAGGGAGGVANAGGAGGSTEDSGAEGGVAEGGLEDSGVDSGPEGGTDSGPPQTEECGEDPLDLCGDGSIGCSNTDEGYTCVCDPSYALDESGHGCVLRWATPQPVELDDAGDVATPVVAMDNAGNAFAAFRQSNGTIFTAWANRAGPDGVWGTPVPFEPAGGGEVTDPPAVAVDPDGNAFAVWHQRDPVLSIYASRYAAGASWSSPVLLETDDSGQARNPAVGMDAAGNAIGVWNQANASRQVARANRYTVADGWGVAEPIDSDPVHSSMVEVAVTGDGHAVAVWQQGAPVADIWANRYEPGEGWGVAMRIETDDAGSAVTPSVAIDGTGNALAVWSQSDGTRNSIWASYGWLSGASWETPERFDTDDTGGAVWPMVAMNGSGAGVAVWAQSDGTRTNVWANRFARPNGWAGPERLETDDRGDASAPDVAIDNSGNILVVWQQSDGTMIDVWSARYYAAGRAWGAPVRIDDHDAGAATAPVVGMNGTGAAIALWLEADGTRVNLSSSRFD